MTQVENPKTNQEIARCVGTNKKEEDYYKTPLFLNLHNIIIHNKKGCTMWAKMMK